MAEQTQNIASWEELGSQLSKLGLHIEIGELNWLSRVLDHAGELKSERDAAEAKLAKTVEGLRGIIDAGGCFGTASYMENVDRIARTTLAAVSETHKLKGQDDE